MSEERHWSSRLPEGATLQSLEVAFPREMPEREPPDSWRWLERRAEACVREQLGGPVDAHMERIMAASPGCRVLYIAAGAAGLSGEGPELPRDAFDLVFCHSIAGRTLPSSLSLDRMCEALRPGGKLVIEDGLVGAGRRQAWEVAREMFAALPVRFRLNHSRDGRCSVDSQLPELPSSEQAPAATDSLPGLLAARLRQDLLVPYFGIAGFFLDRAYGPNYHLALPLDRALFDWIWQMDRYWLGTGRVEPERFFGVYSR